MVRLEEQCVCECVAHIARKTSETLEGLLAFVVFMVVDEYTTRLSPEEFALYTPENTLMHRPLCYKARAPSFENTHQYITTRVPREGSIGVFEIRDRSNLLVALGRINERGLQGEITTYYDGELIMVARYENNMKNGNCLIYKNRVVVFNGRYVHGIRFGRAEETDPVTRETVFVEYDGFGNKKCEISNDNGRRRMIHRTEDVIDAEGSYRTVSYGDSIHYLPEGYFFSRKNGVNTLFYYPLSNSTSSSSVPPLRENDGNCLSVFSYPSTTPKRIYEGTASTATEFKRSQHGRELFYDSVTAEEPFISLYCECAEDRLNGEAHFIDREGICVCDGEYEDNTMSEVTMFDAFEVVYDGLLKDWKNPCLVNALNPLSSFAFTRVESVTVADNLLLKASVLDLSRFVFMRSFVVGRCSFADVNRVYFWHLPFLERIVIRDGAFSARRTAGSGYTGVVSTLPEKREAEESELYVGHCGALREIVIGDNCFTEYDRLRIEGGCGEWV